MLEYTRDIDKDTWKIAFSKEEREREAKIKAKRES